MENRTSLTIGRLNIPYLKLAGKLEFQFILIRELILDRFINENGTFRFQGVTIAEEMRCIDSDFQNIKFNDVDLSCARLILDRSYLSGAYFANTIWPQGHLVQSLLDTETTALAHWEIAASNRIKREVYRQLKQTTNSQGNGIDALKFFRNEMQAYSLYAKQLGQETKANRWLLRISSWTADYGLSYLRPLGWLFVFHFVCFAILLGIAEYKGLYITTNFHFASWAAFSDATGEFFTLLLPTHKMHEYLTGSQMVVDFFMRLFSGYFIYHIIQASRRFVRF